MMINNRPATLYSPEDAEANAQILQAGDSDWTYEAIHDFMGTGWSSIVVHDEDGDLIGSM
jgi:hypothetical protein